MRTARSKQRKKPLSSARAASYGQLTNPFPPYSPFSDDYVAQLHVASLNLLRDQGIRVLHDQARGLYRQAGGRLRDETVFLDEDLINQALKTAPQSFTLHAGTPACHIPIGPGSLFFQPGAGAPNSSDLDGGRRPGTLADFRDLVRLTDAFSVLHTAPPLVEAQDVPPPLRHLKMLEVILDHTPKVPAIYARGRAQVQDSFEMLAGARGLTADEFSAAPHCYTVINTNSPRQLDAPMAEGLIDFARAGQVSVITPFTLMGAMAPISVAGALVLSHAEALAALTLAQLANPGAPILYGTFTSNVHMKSGAPAFGTPEHVQASAGAGQLARFIGLPWRAATGTAANLPDAQAAGETQMGLWGALLAGANGIFHGAGWLEGGLTLSYEKLILDVEILSQIATLCQPPTQTLAAMALDSIDQVPPGGHFFATDHTLAHYRSAFYDPLVFETKPFEAWVEQGSTDAPGRAHKIWQAILAEPTQQVLSHTARGRMQDFVARRTAAGGAQPLS